MYVREREGVCGLCVHASFQPNACVCDFTRSHFILWVACGVGIVTCNLQFRKQAQS